MDKIQLRQKVENFHPGHDDQGVHNPHKGASKAPDIQKPGAKVRFRKGIDPAEDGVHYQVKELRGSRVLLEADMPGMSIKPQTVATWDELEADE